MRVCVYLVEQSDVAGRVFVVEEQEAERADTVVERDDDDSLAGCERLNKTRVRRRLHSVDLLPMEQLWTTCADFDFFSRLTLAPCSEDVS